MKKGKKLLLSAVLGMFSLSCVFAFTSCDDFLVGVKPVLGKHVHNWTDWMEITPATCSEDGEQKRVCISNGCDIVIETQKISAYGHQYLNGVCKTCGDFDSDYKSEGLKYILSPDGDSYWVSDVGVCTDTIVVIPSTYNNLPVTSIDEYAFYGCSALSEILIPNSVTTIAKSAFQDCYRLTKIQIPDSITSINVSAFWNCENLSIYITDIAAWCNINFTSSRIPLLESIRDLYVNNELLTELVIPDNVLEIKDYAFAGCNSLTNVIIPNSVTSIDNAFRDCDGLTNVAIPDSITSIDSAFSNCDSLTSIVIPNSITSISGAFANCTNLRSVVIPDSVTTIGDSTFSNCHSLMNVVIPDTVTAIGNSAFSNCHSLTSMVIPDSVVSIGDTAFSCCYNLTKVVLGKSITSIANGRGKYAFGGCLKLIEIYNKSLLTITAGGNDNGYIGLYAKNVYTPMSGESKLSIDEDGYILYTDGDIVSLVGYNGTDTDLILPMGITEIYKYALCGYLLYGESSYGRSNYDKITSIVIPNSVTSISQDAFYGCYKLTEVIIPDSVTSIGERAFSECYKLTKLVVPDSVISIGVDAFSNCNKLTIYCEAESQPSGWDSSWNSSNRPVVWGYNKADAMN